ncbi:MAG: glycosyl hydrolase 53 family protein [Anaerolineales bacterium]
MASQPKAYSGLMKNRTRIIVLVAISTLVVLLGVFAGVTLPELLTPPKNLVDGSSIHINPIEGLSPDFIMGADVSMLRQIELSGGKYYVNGVEEDCLKILKDHGVNWIRLRIWVNPTDKSGNGLGGGNNDLAKTIEVAARAKKLGLMVLIDFHYSDWWADPGTQTMPRAWNNLGPEELQQAVYDYTASVIQGLVKAHATPDMVQLGNEINGGMLWPEGKIWQEGDEKIGGFDGLAALLKQGLQAVRDNDPHASSEAKRIKIMIHLANGGNFELYHTVFDGLTAKGVEYDVIGLSYYSYWHGPMADLIDNMDEISARYNKPVVIAETAYPFTVDAGDAQPNLFGDGLQELGGYQATVQGQATAMRDVMAAVAQVPDGKGLGIFYWEPDWIPVEGAGWKTGEGDTWENQALFDYQGNALPSLNVFRLVRPEKGGSFIPAKAVELYPASAKVPLDGILQPPVTVKAQFDDDSIREVPVSWEDLDPSFTRNPGKYVFQGTVGSTELKAELDVTVGYTRNYATNPGFETGDFTGWTVQGDTVAVNISNEAQNVYQDNYAAHYWLGTPFHFTLFQTITGLADGNYAFSLWIQGGGGEKVLQLFARDCGGEAQTLDIVNIGWQQWSNPTIKGIQVAGGTCTIGLALDSDAGSWAFIDGVVFFPDKAGQ